MLKFKLSWLLRLLYQLWIHVASKIPGRNSLWPTYLITCLLKLLQLRFISLVAFLTLLEIINHTDLTFFIIIKSFWILLGYLKIDLVLVDLTLLFLNWCFEVRTCSSLYLWLRWTTKMPWCRILNRFSSVVIKWNFRWCWWFVSLAGSWTWFCHI